MSQSLRISCPNCPAQVTVELRQAGQTITCRSCRQTMEVPTMRVLRQLAAESAGMAGDAASTTTRLDRAVAPSSPWKRGLFATGLAVLLLAAAAGGGMLAWANSFRTELPQAQIDKLNRAKFQEIDRASMEQFWAIWQNDVLAWTPGEWMESGLIKNRRAAQFRRRMAFGFFGLAGAGLAAMIASAYIRR